MIKAQIYGIFGKNKNMSNNWKQILPAYCLYQAAQWRIWAR